jgi:hypothetical protein
MGFLKNLFGTKSSSDATSIKNQTVAGNDPAKASIEQLQECAGWLQALVSPRTGQRLFVLHGKAPGSTDISPREYSTIDDVPDKAILFIAPKAKRILTDYPSLGRRVVIQDSVPDDPPFEAAIPSVLDKLMIAYNTLKESKRDAVAIIWYEEGLDFIRLFSAMKSAPASDAGDTTKSS